MLQSPSSSRLAAPVSSLNDMQESSVSVLRQQLEVIFQSNEICHFRRGKEIPMSPTQIWLVRYGVVQLSTLYLNGDEFLIGLASPGLPFGMALTQVDPYIAIALTDVTLIRLNVTDLEQSPVLSMLFMQQFSNRLRQSEALLAVNGHRRIDDRLRYFLILLAQEMGQPTHQGTRLPARLTHQLLANAIGTTRVTITRILGKLRQEGWLEFDQSHHIIIMEQESTAKKPKFQFAA